MYYFDGCPCPWSQIICSAAEPTVTAAEFPHLTAVVKQFHNCVLYRAPLSLTSSAAGPEY